MRTTSLMAISLLLLGFHGNAWAGKRLASVIESCGEGKEEKRSADYILKKFHVTGGRDGACPRNSEIDPNKACLGNVQRIYELGDQWEGARKQTCQELSQVSAQQLDSCVATRSCFRGQNTTLQGLKASLINERKIVTNLANEMKNVRNNTTGEIATPTAEDIGNAEANPNRPIPANREWSNNMGSAISGTNGNDSFNNVMNAIDAARNKDTSAASQVKSPYIKEPLAVAASATEMEKEANLRKQELDGILGEIDSQSAKLSEREKNVGEIKPNSTASDTNTEVTGGGGGEALASGMGAGAAGAGLMNSHAGGESMSSYPGEDGRNNALTGQGPVRLDGGTSADAANQEQKIGSLAKAKSEKSGLALTSGASVAPDGSEANSLRDRVRAKLRAASAEGVVAGGGEEGASTGEAKSAAAAKAHGIRTGMVTEGDLAPFQANGISNNGFSMAGSETENAVKNMMQEFQGDRGPASLDEAEELAAIQGAESMSLFLRTRETHQRCLMRGLVTNRRSL